MKQTQAIEAFAALAQDTRLAALRLLIKDGPEGMPAGVIAERIGVPASTLSFHIGALERAGLVRSWRVQRQIFYAPNFGGVRQLLDFLMLDCCGGHPEICSAFFADPDATSSGSKCLPGKAATDKR